MAEDLGGRIQPASGALSGAKGDVRKVGEIRGEAKTTSKSFFVLKLAELLKIRLEAITGGLEDWVFQIEFQGQMGQNKKFAVMDYFLYVEWAASSQVHDMQVVEGKSFRVRLAEAAPGPLELIWKDPNPHMPTHRFIILPWYTYTSLREGQPT